MKKLLLCAAIFFASFSCVFAQANLQWWKNFTRDSIFNIGLSIDKSSNLYTTVLGGSSPILYHKFFPNGYNITDTVADGIIVLDIDFQQSDYVVLKYDFANQKMILVKLSSQDVEIWRQEISSDGPFTGLTEILKDKSGNYLFLHSISSSVSLTKISNAGAFVFSINTFFTAQSCDPVFRFAFDNLDNIYAYDGDHHDVYVLSPTGQLLRQNGISSCISGIADIIEIIFDSDNYAYFIYYYQGAVSKKDSTFTTLDDYDSNETFDFRKAVYDSTNRCIYILATNNNGGLKLVNYSMNTNDTVWTRDLSVPKYSIHSPISLYLSGDKLIATSSFRNGWSATEQQYGIVEIDTSGNIIQHYFLAKRFPFAFAPDAPFEDEIDGAGNLYMTKITGNDEVDIFKICLHGCRSESSLHGYLFHDQFNNCQIDSSTVLIPDKIISLYNGNYTNYTYSDNTGYFEFYPDTGTYQLEVVDFGLTNNWSESCNPGQIYVTGNNSLSTDYNIGYSASGYRDIAVDISHPVVRPGFMQTHFVRLSNFSNIPENGYVKLILDSVFSYFYSSVVPDSITSNTLVWNFSNLLPLGIKNIAVATRADVNSLNSPYTNIVTAYPIDSFPVNNVAVDSGIVVGSCDPNEKTVLPSGFILESDSILNYTIRFQNTGTDTAFTVIVMDTIDTEKLDIGSLKMILYSHTYRLDIINNSVLRWTFNDILLPDSTTNELLSHGLIQFSIKKKHNLPIGSIISNRVAIYFDFNEPIITNTVENTLTELVGIRNWNPKKGNDLYIYPNPASSELWIKCYEHRINSVAMYDVTGKEVISYQTSSNNKTAVLNISEVSNGLYFIHTYLSNGETVVRKVIKD